MERLVYGWCMDAPATDTAPHPIGPREIGSTGVVVHPLAIDGSIFGWAAGEEAAAEILDLFRASGGTLVTTADHYAAGRSELMIGSWLRTVRDRSSVVIATKVGRHPDAAGLSQRTVLRAAEASLYRLGTDYVDFLSFDGEHPENPIDESLEAADRLIREGKVRFLAESGYSARRIEDVHRMAVESAYPDFRALFVEYSLMNREHFEADLSDIACRLGRGALARLPLASGYLTGRYRTRDDIPESVMFGGAMQHVGRRGNRVLEALDTVATEIGHTPGRVALAWVLRSPGIAAAAVRVKDAEQLRELLDTVTVRLTRHHVAMLNRASAP